MKILVINGSPKGNYSVTLQTVLYLQKKFANDDFEFLNVGQQIKKYEKDMTSVVTAVESAELILFSYPVYTFLAPSQLHRFIELLKENKIDVSGKMAAQITTSKHFYDMTAHQYIKDNCDDLGLLYLEGLSADMDDLLTEKGQKEATMFWNYVHFCAENKIYNSLKKHNLKSLEIAKDVPTTNSDSFEIVGETAVETQTPTVGRERDIVIVTDCKNDERLAEMIEKFQKASLNKTRIVNISDYKFDGGCLGCFKCAQSGKCVYRDNFDSFLRENIQSADAIIFAFTIKDHSMGARFKLYDDRQFCNGHRAVTVGMPMGYLINGKLDGEENLRTVIAGRIEVGHNFLCGIASTEGDTSLEIKQLVLKLNYALENKTLLPQNFYGVGGTKIFRDLIYVMRGLMKADHKFYKANGIYDFPQKKRGTIIKMQFVGLLMSIPSVSKKMGNKMNDEIIKPYQKVIENIKESRKI